MKRENFKRAKLARMRSALTRLEIALSKFQEAKKDKNPWSSSRKCRPHMHSGKSYDSECNRMSQEISKLKEKISLAA